MRIFVTFRDTNSWIITDVFPLIYIKDWQSKGALHWCARQITLMARQNLSPSGAGGMTDPGPDKDSPAGDAGLAA